MFLKTNLLLRSILHKFKFQVWQTVYKNKKRSQVDPKQSFAQNLNRIWEYPFWYNPILNKRKSQFGKKRFLNNWSQLDPKKTLAQNLNPSLENTFWYNPIFEKKENPIKNEIHFEEIKCSQVDQKNLYSWPQSNFGKIHFETIQF